MTAVSQIPSRRKRHWKTAVTSHHRADQPRGFVKHFGKYDKIGARMLGHRYPEMKRQIFSRPERYNETVKYCEQLETEGKAMIIRPTIC